MLPRGYALREVAGAGWWLWYLLGATAATATIGLVPVAVAPLAYTAVEISAVVALGVGLRVNEPPQRQTWRLILVAVALLTATRLVWRVSALVEAPLPSWPVVAEWLYLGVYLLLAVALGILPLRVQQCVRLNGMTEAGILVCTVVVLAWSGVIDPLLESLQSDALVSVTASLLPLLGLLMVASTARRVLTASTRTPSGVLAVIAVTALLIGDTGAMVIRLDQGSTLGATPSMMGWLVAALLLAAAALHPSAANDDQTGSEATAAAGRGVTARGYALLIMVGPIATAISLLRERHNTAELHLLHVAVPLTATTATAILLVFRLTTFARMAEQRATALETALTEQMALREELSHQASHDPLTGLPNRRYLSERIDQVLVTGAPATLLLFDLDGFKDVNDRYGHEVGDELLVAIADQVQQIVPSPHTLARLGGDEFAVLLERATHEQSVGCAEAILAALRRPFQVSPYQLYTAASMGLRSLDPDAGAARILSDTDMALYAAKAAGRDQLLCYDPQLRTRHLAQARMVDRLRAALDQNELTVFYQPVVDLTSNRWVTVEALARWEADDGGSVSPDQFIPVAEDSGLIVTLGTWVLRHACQDAVGWHRDHGTRLAVNVSVHQLWEANFAAVVLTALGESGLPPHALSLEITESVLVGAGTQRTRAIAHLSELREAGVRVAIDDFGTGYSSLAYLHTLPIDAVKIDRAFVPCEQSDDAQQVALVRAIVELAHSLGLGTVVEGVETAAQATVLQGLGCDLGQGYHYSRPVSAAAISTGLPDARS